MVRMLKIELPGDMISRGIRGAGHFVIFFKGPTRVAGRSSIVSGISGTTGSTLALCHVINHMRQFRGKRAGTSSTPTPGFRGLAFTADAFAGPFTFKAFAAHQANPRLELQFLGFRYCLFVVGAIHFR